MLTNTRKLGCTGEKIYEYREVKVLIANHTFEELGRVGEVEGYVDLSKVADYLMRVFNQLAEVEFTAVPRALLVTDLHELVKTEH